MPMLHICGHNGCETLTLGGLCIAHETPVEARAFPRGRPFPPLEPRRSRPRPSFLADDPVFEEREELIRGFA
jgi:hypothetical protein